MLTEAAPSLYADNLTAGKVVNDGNTWVDGNFATRSLATRDAGRPMRMELLPPFVTSNPLFEQAINVETVLDFKHRTTPVGMIVMWSGPLTEIPYGWALCDGVDGRPDLRDKFLWQESVDVLAGKMGTTEGSNETKLPSWPVHFHRTAELAMKTRTVANTSSHTHKLRGELFRDYKSGGPNTNRYSHVALFSLFRKQDARVGQWGNPDTPALGFFIGDVNVHDGPLLQRTHGTGIFATDLSNTDRLITLDRAAADEHSHTMSPTNHRHGIEHVPAQADTQQPVSLEPPYLALAYIIRTSNWEFD